MRQTKHWIGLLAFVLMACGGSKKEPEMKNEIQKKADEFASFKLTTDLSVLTEKEKQMLPYLFQAARLMDDIFWKEAYGDKNEILGKATDPATEKFIRINYGPWERLNDNKPFLEGLGPKPAGAGFYPVDMTKAEFEAWNNPDKTSLYTKIERAEDGSLKAVPYHEAFAAEITQAADLIKKAAELAEDPGLKKYLELRAEALLTDRYFESDMAWMDMKTNTIDFVVGPIESYEDQLFGYKAAHEAYILVKDQEWSKKLDRFAALLPKLQKDLPCDPAYKNEMPGSDSDLNAYDVVFYAGDCNAGSKTIAINLPNDEKVRAEKGSRKLQLKNAMQAKFDKIMLPIAGLLIDPEQISHVKFDAFFENTMFHEVSHGLGLGKTIKGDQTVRQALKETYSSIEEGKADILGLWCVYKLSEMGELKDKDLMDNFVTFMAGIFRSIRFGAASAHGKANMMRFNYFEEAGAFVRNPETGYYHVDFEKMKQAMFDLSALILKIQGDGDYDQAVRLLQEKSVVKEDLQKDLDRIAGAGIPRDIVFEQGPEALGLQ
jgi:hypothetical protein